MLGPWSYFGAFGQFGEPGQICLIDQSDLYNHDIHDIRNRRARERRRSSLEFRGNLAIIELVYVCYTTPARNFQPRTPYFQGFIYPRKEA